MFSFFKRKPKDTPPQPPAPAPAAIPPDEPVADIAQPTETATPVIAPLPEAPSRSDANPVAHPASAPPSAAAPVTHGAMPASPAVAAAEPAADEEIVPVATTEQEKKSWLNRLRTGLSKTSSSLTTLFVGARIDDDLYEELETALLMADAGVEATEALLVNLKKRVKEQKLADAAQVRIALRDLIAELLKPLEKPLVLGRHKPTVMMIAGVNGAGKTTTIGKLARHLQTHGQSVLLAAGDTFRAAAREQLAVWGQRNQVHVISQQSGDPAAVAFDAVQSAQARSIDIVMVDTAGRLPTQSHLMEELRKIRRVITKGMDSAPHEVLLVIDGNTGQNAVAQVKAFDDVLSLTGLIVTKLDGTAKGGVLAAIVKARPIPVYFIGIGEKIEDLQPFRARDFADALLGLSTS